MAIVPIGRPGNLHRPVVELAGEPIEGFVADYVVGAIPTASVSLPPETMKAVYEAGISNPIQITVDGMTLFTGFVNGPSGTIGENSLQFGVDLIHPARTLDEGRCFAPGVHPMSTDDYSFVMSSGGDDTASGPFDDIRTLKFDVGANLGEEIPAYLIRVMAQLQEAPASAGLPRMEGFVGNVKENNGRVVQALGAIRAVGGCALSLSGSTAALQGGAKLFAQKVVSGSVGSMKSAWDVLVHMFSAFGMTVLCRPDGLVWACPDFSGCIPPEGNRIGPELGATLRMASRNSREPGGVLVVSHGFDRGSSGGLSGDRAIGPRTAAIGSYIPEGDQAPRGGLVTVGLPGWMIPQQMSDNIPEIDDKLIQDYARQIYGEVRGQHRSMAVTCPMAPIHPGTTYTVEPVSAMVPFSGEDLPFGGRYHGYCYRVVHSVSSSQPPTTTAYFRNTFGASEEDLMVEGAPFLSGQAPFPV